MPNLNREIQEIAARLLPQETPTGKPAQLLQGVVAGVSLGRLDVYLSGTTLPVSGIRYLRGYRPVLGELVWLLRSGGDTWCLGALGMKPGNPAIESWRLVGAAGQPTFQNGWQYFGAPYSTPAFAMASNGWVHLKGLLAAGTSTAVMFTLPTGYRPPFDLRMTCESANAPAELTITTSGTVTKNDLGDNTHVSIDGLTFPTAETWARIRQEFVGLVGVNAAFFSASTPSVPEVYHREDGWNWMKGIVQNTAAPQDMAIIPERGRVETAVMLPAKGLGVARIDVDFGGYYECEIGSGTGVSVVLGGLNYWSESGYQFQQWVNATYLNGWTTHGGGEWRRAQYLMDAFGFVHIRGLVNGAAKTSNVIFNLPEGFRPAEKKVFNSVKSNNIAGRTDVYSNGDVEAFAGVANYNSIYGMFKAEQ